MTSFVPLPRFTFLCGQSGLGQSDLILKLVQEDDNLIRLDFTYFVQDIISQLFPETFPATTDPLVEPDMGVFGYPVSQAPDDDYVSISTVSVRQFYHSLIDALRATFGPNFLGLMALRHYQSHDLGSTFQRVIFSDTPSPEDVEVFINKYGPESCLCIHLGDLSKQMGTDKLPCSHIWLPFNETKRQISFLRQELSSDRPSQLRASS